MASDKSLENLRVSPLSILGFTLSWFVVTALASLALSAVALSEIKHNKSTLRGTGLARWGVALSMLSILWLGLCMAAYQHNLGVYRTQLQWDQTAIEGARQHNPGLLQDDLSSYEDHKKNPPSFFNPFQ